jgi:hypothetical protein
MPFVDLGANDSPDQMALHCVGHVGRKRRPVLREATTSFHEILDGILSVLL